MSDEKERQKIISESFEEALNSTSNDFIREIKKDFINEKYGLDRMATNETDFILGMLVNQMSHRFFFSVTEHNLEVTDKDIEYFYEQVFNNLDGLKRGIIWILEK